MVTHAFHDNTWICSTTHGRCSRPQHSKRVRIRKATPFLFGSSKAGSPCAGRERCRHVALHRQPAAVPHSTTQRPHGTLNLQPEADLHTDTGSFQNLPGRTAIRAARTCWSPPAQAAAATGAPSCSLTATLRCATACGRRAWSQSTRPHLQAYVRACGMTAAQRGPGPVAAAAPAAAWQWCVQLLSPTAAWRAPR
jgi:hypothetical protein